MSEGYYSVSSNGSDAPVRQAHKPDACPKTKMRESPKQSNLRSSSTLALNTLSTSEFSLAAREDAPLARVQPHAMAEGNAAAASQPQSRTGSGASSSVETVIFRGRAKSNTETILSKAKGGDVKGDADGMSTASKVPQATVLPRSVSVFALNSQTRQGISQPLRQDHRRPPQPPPDHQRHHHHHQQQQQQQQYQHHLAQQQHQQQHHPALPSYPAYPLPSAYPSHRSDHLPFPVPEMLYPCAGCGLQFAPRCDERGLALDSYCNDCHARASSSSTTAEERRQQQRQQQQQKRGRISGGAITPLSPSKRGSWHADVDYQLPPSQTSYSAAAATTAPGGGGGVGTALHRQTSAPPLPAATAFADVASSPLMIPPSQYAYLPNQLKPPPPASTAHSTSSPSSASSVGPSADPSRWDSLRRAADSIIKEKDAVIDKQRQQIQQLEQLARQAQQQSELNEQQQLYRHSSSYDPYLVQQQTKDLDVKMQEFQYETAAVRAQLTEATSASKMELDDLTRKLAETELDSERNKRTFEEELSRQRKIAEDARKKLADKLADYDEVKLKYKAKEKELSRAKKNLSNIEAYLARLPTPQEVEEREARLVELDEALRRTDERTKVLEEEVGEARGEAEAKAVVIQSLEQAEDEWKAKLECSNREREKYRDLLRSLRGGAEGAGGGDSDSGVSVEDMEDEIQRLKGDTERLKKLVETQQKRHKTQQRELKMEQQDLEDQLKKEQEKVSSIETKLKQREAEVDRLRDRVNDDDAIKESLRERVTQLTEELSDVATGGEEAALKEKMQQRLAEELIAVFGELQGLVQICNDEAEGKDPNMSVLLGLRRNDAGPVAAAGGDSGGGGDGALDAAARLAQAKALRKEVDRLRTVVSNKIAESMGDNLDCTQQ